MARNVVSSRNFTIIINGKKSFALIPFADLLNHSFNNNTNYNFNSLTNSFEFINNKKIRYREQVTDSYGNSKLSKDFLSYYGFFEPKNHQIIIMNYILTLNKIKLPPVVINKIRENIKQINETLKTNEIKNKTILQILLKEKKILEKNL